MLEKHKTIMEVLKTLIREVEKDERMVAVILFGSFARGENFRDIDVCLVLKKKPENLEMSRIRLEYLSKFPALDIQIFQQLPIYIRARILREGKVIYCKDEDLLYDIAILTIKEFEDFKHVYKEYLEGVLHG